jgi:hypothetical protein
VGLNLKKEDVTVIHKNISQNLSPKVITNALTITCFPENLSNGAGANLK